MLYTLKSAELTVTVNDLGAELLSVRREKTDTEYLWQGDPAYWAGHAPLMFPFCGRVQGGEYSHRGKVYPMGCHGFAADRVFAAERRGEDFLSLALRSNADTRSVYPFDFILTVTYRLAGNRLKIRMTVKNTGEETLPFMVGAHPGFRVPLDEGRFEDWFLEFGEACRPNRMNISKGGFRTGTEEPYPLDDGRILRLSHRLFDVDGIFLREMASSVTLRSLRSERFVRLSYPNLPYLGFWHGRGEAPYLCVEPWSGMPAVEGESEDLERKTDLFYLGAGEEKTVSVEMIFG